MAPILKLNHKNSLKKIFLNLTWTDEEKIQLLEALQKYGVNDIRMLSSAIPSKSSDEIRAAIFNYERVAIKSLKNEEFASEDREAPLDKWMKLLKEHSNDVFASRDILTALKIIAYYEERPKNSNVDLMCCYEYLISVMDGRAPKQLDEESMEFLMNSFAQLGALLKSEDTSKEEQFLNNLQISELSQKTYLSKKGNIVGDPNLNLLKVPLGLLKFKNPTSN